MTRDLHDVDVVIPVRIDSPDRLENLDTVLSYFDASFHGHRIAVLEHAATPEARACAAAHGADYHFIESRGCFHKSRIFNLGVALADRPYVLLYDCDVLLPPAALVEARRQLAEDRLDFVYPYNGILLQLPRERLRDHGITPSSLLQQLPACVTDRHVALPPGVEFLHGTSAEPSAGAALMAVRRRLVLAGGFNENIVSYGCEDTELATRLRILGERVAWLGDYSAYHVSHRRGTDSHYNNFHRANLAEWRKVEAMDRPTLEGYVRNGFRALQLDSTATLVIENTPDAYAIRLDPAAGTALAEVAFVLPVARPSATMRRLVEGFLDRLDATYDNYELQLIEIGGYDFHSSAHRDHVLYVHADADQDWLRAAVARTERPVICVCSPLTDIAPAGLLAAVAHVLASSHAVARLPTAPPAGLAAPHVDKLVATVLGTLPIRGAALLFASAAFTAAAFAPSDAAGLDLDALARSLAGR